MMPRPAPRRIHHRAHLVGAPAAREENPDAALRAKTAERRQAVAASPGPLPCRLARCPQLAAGCQLAAAAYPLAPDCPVVTKYCDDRAAAMTALTRADNEAGAVYRRLMEWWTMGGTPAAAWR
jgi:hypothetical protein